MSTLRETRRIALASLVATAALAGAASSAQAATTTLNLSCKFPLLGIQPVTLQVDATLPPNVDPGVPTEPFDLVEKITLGGNVSEGAPLFNGATVEGDARTTGTVAFNGSVISLSTPGSFGPIAPPEAPAPIVVDTTASVPSLTFDDPGTAKFSITGLSLNLTWRDPAGDVIELPALRTDVDGNPVTDSDGDPATTDVYCKVDAGQDGFLGDIIVNGPVVGLPTITAVSGAKPKAGVGGSVVVKGTNLGTTTQVTVDGAPATFTKQGKNLKVQLPALAAGDHQLVVTNDKGASAPTTVTYK